MASKGVRWILLLKESGNAIPISAKHAYSWIFSSSVEISYEGLRILVVQTFLFEDLRAS